MNQPVYTTAEPKKHRAFILAVDADYFENQLVHQNGMTVSAFHHPINMYPHELFLDQVQSDLVIREREYLDNGVTTHASRRGADGKFKKGNPRYKQILPYLVARQEQADGTMLFFPYRRTSGVGESRLAGNGSVGYGGHIDLEDIVFTKSVIDLKETILKSTLREAIEEFTMYPDTVARITAGTYKDCISFGDLFIVDNSNDVGELHLGLIMHFDVPTGWTLRATEDELARLPAMTAEQMLADENFKPESWTQIYLDLYTKIPSYFKRTIGIDHGGEQVGQVNQTFLDGANLEALEAGVADNGDIAGTGFAADQVDEDYRRIEMPNPTAEDLQDPVFNAIYEAAKTWDVGVHTSYIGHCGFNGSHAKIILDSIRNAEMQAKQEVDSEPVGDSALKVKQLVKDHFVSQATDSLKEVVAAGVDALIPTGTTTTLEGVITCSMEAIAGRTMIKIELPESADPHPVIEAAMQSALAVMPEIPQSWPKNEKEAINLGRNGVYALPGTPTHLAEIQNQAAATYHGLAQRVASVDTRTEVDAALEQIDPK